MVASHECPAQIQSFLDCARSQAFCNPLHHTLTLLTHSSHSSPHPHSSACLSPERGGVGCKHLLIVGFVGESQVELQQSCHVILETGRQAVGIAVVPQSLHALPVPLSHLITLGDQQSDGSCVWMGWGGVGWGEEGCQQPVALMGLAQSILVRVSMHCVFSVCVHRYCHRGLSTSEPPV
jgi:hypothetical protein